MEDCKVCNVLTYRARGQLEVLTSSFLARVNYIPAISDVSSSITSQLFQTIELKLLIIDLKVAQLSSKSMADKMRRPYPSKTKAQQCVHGVNWTSYTAVAYHIKELKTKRTPRIHTI